MAGATALFSDGLDLLAEFLAASRAVDDGMAVTYDQPLRWHAAAAELARWSGAGPDGAHAMVLDHAALRITVPPALWNQLYARALSIGRGVAPDRIGVATRGVGGMLAELSRFPAMAAALQGTPAPLADDAEHDADDEPWLLLPWPPLKALLLRDRLLVQDAMRPRPLLDRLPAGTARLDASVQRHGLLLQQEGQGLQLFCPRAWFDRMAGELRCHFTESVLLLFRLMFYSHDQGWGWEAESAQCAGLVALMDDAERAGLARFGSFRDSCALLARVIGGGDAGPSCGMLMAAAVLELAALWPTRYLQAGQPSCKLMAGWMTQVHPEARIASDALLGPGVIVGRDCVVGAGAVLQNGAEIARSQVVPPGVVIGAGALVGYIALSGNVLPPATLLRGSLILYRKASVGRQVTLGANAEIGFGVAIPDGVQVADGAGVYALHLGKGVHLPAGTVIEGSLHVEADVEFGSGIRVGANVQIRRGASIGDGVCLPPNIIVAAGACIQRCSLGKGARLGPAVILHGDLALGPRAEVGAGASLGGNAVIGAGVMVPAGVTVQAGAHIGLLKLHGCWLPPGTVLGGSLRLGRHCEVGSGVVFEGDNWLASHIALPDGVRIARGARIEHLQLGGARLAPGTVLCGNAFVAPGTRIGRGVTLEAGTLVTVAALPDGVTVMRRGVVNRCDVAGVRMRHGTRIGGDLYLAPGVQLGWNVRLHKDVRVNCICQIPDGVELMPGAIIDWFQIAPDVSLPPGTRIGGSLRLEDGVLVGAGVRFGADAVVGRAVTIPNGAQLGQGAVIRMLDIAPDAVLPSRYTLHGDAVLGAGSALGERVVLGAEVDVGAGVLLPPGVILADHTRIRSLRIADDVILPAGAMLGGDLTLRRGVRVGQEVEFGAGADIGPHVVLPDRIVLASGATVRLLAIAADAVLGRGITLCGDATIGAGVRIDDDVVLGAGAMIGAGIHLPGGVVVAPAAKVGMLRLGADVRLPQEFSIAGDLCLEDRAIVGARVRFGAGVLIGADVLIGEGVVIGDNVVVCAGAVIGDEASLAAGAVVEAGTHIGRGAQFGCIRPAADAHFSCWQAYLSGEVASEDVASEDEPQPVVAEAMPPSSAPVDIPVPMVQRPLHGHVTLPRPFT